MPVYVSYIADEKLSQEIWGICRSASSNVKTCIIDISSVHHVFDSGIALLPWLECGSGTELIEGCHRGSLPVIPARELLTVL